MSDSPREYAVGDVVNGCMLSSDGTWTLIAPDQQSSAAHVPAWNQIPLTESDLYWARFKRRWPVTALIMAAVGFLAGVSHLSGGVTSYGVGTVIGQTIGAGLLWGSAVSCVVAIPKSRRERAHTPGA